MEKNLFKYIWKYSKVEQIVTLSLILVSFPFLYYSMDLPKTIINNAINIVDGEGDFSLFSYEFSQLEYLFILCGIFLLLVLINGAFKYKINIYKGVMAERLLRRLRYMLIERSLRFPITQFQRTSPGEIVTMVTAEVEPLGGFFGDSFALLAFQGGTFITIMFFMFMQDPWLGLAAFSSIPIQGYIIPKLQKHINLLSKERVRHVRSLSNRINEVVSGIEDIHAQDHTKYVLADISKRLGNIFWVRFDIYKRKFFMKFLNNIIGQMTPFFFYSIGGYLVIKGDLTFGALVASLAAYKDLASPWKELLNYYQIMADSKIKYEQLRNQFEPVGMLPSALMTEEPDHIHTLEQQVDINNLTWIDDDGIRPIDGVNFQLPSSSSTLLTSSSGAGRDAITLLLARLLMPTRGKINIGDIDLSNQHEAITGRRIGMLPTSPGFFNGNIADNILMGLMHKTPEEKELGKDRANQIHEAKASGNSSHNSDFDWINYPLAGTAEYETLRIRTETLLNKVELDQDFHDLGLRLPADPKTNPELVKKALKARAEMTKYLSSRGMDDLVKNFHMDEYNDYSSVAENILFGKPTCEEFNLENLSKNPIILSLLDEERMSELFLQTGIKCATLMVDLFKDLPSGHAFFEQYSFVEEDRLNELKHLVGKIELNSVESIDRKGKEFLMSIPFQLTPQRHRLGLITDEIRSKLIKIRHKLHKNHPELFESKIQAFDVNTFNAGSSIQENILFGRVAYGRADADEKVMAAINKFSSELGMRSTIIRMAFSYQVGIGGSKLSSAQRQKMALLRNLIKNPDILILNDGLNMLETEDQARIINTIKKLMPNLTLLWVSNAAPAGIDFDQHLTLFNGKVTSTNSTNKAEIIEQIPEAEPGEEMAMKNEIQALQNVPLFANLDPSRLKFLAFTSERKTYEAGEVLIRQNDPGDAAYIILSGQADVLLTDKNGNEIILIQLGQNQLVGELALLCNTPRTATVRANSHVSALKLSKEIFTELARQDAQFSFEMARLLSQRLVTTTNELNAR